MSYVFDPTAGESRAELAARVTFNSFSDSRYAEFVKRALNDAVTAICRKLEQIESYEVLSYDANGVVADPAKPWFRIDEVWSASATVAASGEKAYMTAANYQLQTDPGRVLGEMSGSGAIFYIARRRAAPTGFSQQLDLRILPPGAAGFVAIKGLQRPPVMDADGVVTGLGADLDSAVVAYAKAECFNNEDDWEGEDRQRARYLAKLYEVVEGGTTNDGPTTVDGTWAS